MKSDQRKYILQHYKSQSSKQIAAHLNIKERTVQRFIDSQQVKVDDAGGKGKSDEKKKKIRWLLLFAVILCGFLVYSSSLKGELIWDDNILIRNNSDLRDWGHLKEVFFGNLGGEGLYYKHSSYRPVQTLTYMVDYSIWKLNPFGYHMTNIICHLLAAGLLYIFIFKIFSSNYLSFITAFLFVLHPTHTEAVTYISGRADPLSAVFMLASMIFYLRSQEKEKMLNHVMMAVMYILGILSRENALMVPVFILVYHAAIRLKINWRPMIIYASIAAFYIYLRVKEVIGGMGLDEPVKTSILERIPGFFVAYLSYLKLMILPFNLHMEYLRPLFYMSDPRAIAGGILFLITILVAYFGKKNKLVIFGLLWFLVGLFPVANVFVVVNAYMAEHWLYIPSMGLFLVMAGAITKLSSKNEMLRSALFVFVLLLGTFYGYLTYQQNKTWLNQIDFYERTRKFAPDSARLHADLGEAYYRVGRVEDSRDSTIRAIQLRPNYYAAWSNLGTIYVRLGEIDKAIEAYQNSLKISPGYFNAHFNLANIYKDQEKFDEAITHYEQALKYKPSLAMAYNNLAICYNQKGNLEKAKGNDALFRTYKEIAIENYQKGINFEPNTKFYNNLASALSDVDRHQEAIELYNKALQLGPDIYDGGIIMYNLALEYYRIKDTTNFLSTFERANSIPINSASTYERLASMYSKMNLKKEAEILLQKARESKSRGKNGK
ncbi:MAG: tetratricopeptide repeat protein [Candidatus Omnitrophica bacterium]|nr:tetratricopeptide repeat protein [Candidatus Omnitrophota bacterium]